MWHQNNHNNLYVFLSFNYIIHKSSDHVSQVLMTTNGMAYRTSQTNILLDPKSACGTSFVSHAHMDHLPSTKSGTILTSDQTAQLAALRGCDLGECTEHVDGMELYDSGHILGSRGLLVDDMFYTGDICTRSRGFLRGAIVPKCHTLIIESTFGLPEFSFPDTDSIRSRVDELVAMLYSRGIPVILMGYSLGKAQTLSQMFAHWEPMYYHDSVRAMNALHRLLGIDIPDRIGHTEADTAGLLDKNPWVMIAPPMTARTKFIKDMKRRGAVTVSFSGWADSIRFPYARGGDYFIPLSDHCDYAELLHVVERSGAERIYTVHGFVEEFAADLCQRGFDAMPLATQV